MIGKLLGHWKVQTTARYAHLARESVKTSAARVAESIAADMEEPPTAPVAESNGLTTWKSVDVLCREDTQPYRLVHSKKTAAETVLWEEDFRDWDRVLTRRRPTDP